MSEELVAGAGKAESGLRRSGESPMRKLIVDLLTEIVDLKMIVNTRICDFKR